jgi:hypothetical protein
MQTFYVDETGFTGEDLLAAEQPLFVQATVNYSKDETQKIVGEIFINVQSDELKHKNLSRKTAHQDRIVELVKYAVANPGHVGTWVAHKEFAAVTFIVEWWIEPLAKQAGLNLYKDGANHAMANMLFMCLQGFWDAHFRRKVLMAFQRMFRARTQERFDECRKLVAKLMKETQLDEARADIARYLWAPFEQLGFAHLVRLPSHALDLAFPGLVRIGFWWRAKSAGPWEVVHDRSSNMAKQKWLWDKLSAVDLGEAQFDGPQEPAIFPMNVLSTRFADSKAEMQIQICDLFAGATSAALRLPPDDSYRKKLDAAGIHELVIDQIWPSSAITPDELGKKGWDGNKAIDWIAEAVANKDATNTAK